jgi:transcriptional regulator with XRE-family HTH domain
MDFAEDFRKIRESLGISQQKMAEMIGIPQKTWSNYENGRTRPKMDVLLALAEKGHTIKGLTTGILEDMVEDGKISKEKLRQNFSVSGSMPVYTRAVLEKNGNAFVIPFLNQKLSAGTGQELPNDDESTALIPIPNHLAKYGKNLAILTVEGDSMYPTLDRGDMVVCDSCGWSGEGVYALRMSGDGFVKRLSKTPGKLVIISDNPKYPVREEPEESQDFEIIGRVHLAIKNME